MKNNFYVLKIKKISYIIVFILVLILLFIYSKSNVNTIKETTNLFLYSVFPALFPFAFFTEFVLNTDILNIISNKLKKVILKFFPVSIYSTFAIIIGFLCGFPSGSKSIIKLYNEQKITYTQAKILLSFNNNCSPIFIYVAVGISIFNNKEIGIILLISHFLASIIIGNISSFLYTFNIIHEKSDILKIINKKNTINSKKILVFDNIKNSLKNSFLILANIFGFMLLFSLISNNTSILLNKFNIDINISNLITSLFEITTGIIKINSTSFLLETKIILTSILLGISGICVIFQIYSVVYKYKFSLTYLIFVKLLHGALSGLICYIILKLNIFTIVSTSDVFSNFENYNLIQKINLTDVLTVFYLIISLLIFNILLEIFILKIKKIAKI